MGKLTDNAFSKTFFSQMQDHLTIGNHAEISKMEIQKCWQQQLPFLYKDSDRVRKSSRFVRANADGSEDIVELINTPRAIYSQDIKFKKIKTSRNKGEGVLFTRIKK